MEGEYIRKIYPLPIMDESYWGLTGALQCFVPEPAQEISYSSVGTGHAHGSGISPSQRIIREDKILL